MKKGNITIYDIAKEANVSPATVSRVLTGNAKVRPQTMRKIVEVIEKYNFRPNSLARSLYHKQSKTIGFIVPDINHTFFSTLVQKSEELALELGYTTFL
ncbi:MAG TPA: LacI family DNA-binding transcriptional regulator, partial [Metabacillus sp.]|nr:LacI family DNA-binding transcriptional regulator [Metabacillus sp.]